MVQEITTITRNRKVGSIYEEQFAVDKLKKLRTKKKETATNEPVQCQTSRVDFFTKMKLMS